MSLAISSPILPPPPVPPDLLFLQSFSDLKPVPASRDLLPSPSPSEISVLPLVSPVEAEAGYSIQPPASLQEKLVLWVDKVKSSFQPLSKVASPSISDDGIPSILAPDSISLVSSDLWKDHLAAFFHGTPPSAAKVFNDLNPIWGKNGRISVKLRSKFSYVIYIPCVISRKWALDVGFWHSGNCSFTVAAWYPSINLSSMKLVYAPVWVLFRKVPKELWSLVGFNTLASAVGFPVHSEFSDLKPYSNGVIKLRVVVELDKPRPSTVRISDRKGNQFLFQQNSPRCLPNAQLEQFAVDVSVVQAASDQSSKALTVDEGFSSTADTLDDVQARRLVRSRSLPIHHGLRAEKCSSLVWVEVTSRSKPKPKEPPSQSRSSVPVTNSKFAEEEELIYEAQRILRARLAAVGTSNPEPSASMSRKHARRKIRQQLYLLATSDTRDGSSNSTAVSVKNKDFGLASDGQAHLHSVHSQEA
ncbi:hypothetical protein Bca101_078865 [Brassica carinata]